MISASPELIALLNAGGPYYIADLLTLTLLNGTVLRYTNCDVDLVYGGDTFAHDGLLFKRGACKISVGISVDTNEVTLYPQPGYRVGGVALQSACNNGVLDGARLRIERAFCSTPGGPVVGAIWRFSGWCAEMDVGAQVVITARALTELLNVKWPPDIYSASCLHTLYSAGCGVIKAAYTVAGAVTAASAKSAINCALSQAAGYFDQGMVAFTSGANAGARRTVKSYTPGVVRLNFPLLNVPSPGDTFSIWPGCDKTQPTCVEKFANGANFKGFRFIPVPETSV